jgi:hypothetical protein
VPRNSAKNGGKIEETTNKIFGGKSKKKGNKKQNIWREKSTETKIDLPVAVH